MSSNWFHAHAASAAGSALPAGRSAHREGALGKIRNRGRHTDGLDPIQNRTQEGSAAAEGDEASLRAASCLLCRVMQHAKLMPPVMRSFMPEMQDLNSLFLIMGSRKDSRRSSGSISSSSSSNERASSVYHAVSSSSGRRGEDRETELLLYVCVRRLARPPLIDN